jgi:hypothetical protein
MNPHFFSNKHVYRVGTHQFSSDDAIDDAATDLHRKHIEPWLSAVFQSEHLSLLVGSGLSTAISYVCNSQATGMGCVEFSSPFADKVDEFAEASAIACGRGQANIEDQIRSAITLIAGLEVLQHEHVNAWKSELDTLMRGFLASLLKTEQGILAAFSEIETGNSENQHAPHHLLVSFLLSFASRSASRERLHLFTTNYDRLLEFGCDLAGLRVIDRFVGALTPIFRSSRLEVDYHYNPPGIRGEPRYLEGVVQLTKLHGSLDWRWDRSQLRKYAVPFGASELHPDIVGPSVSNTMIYPNPAKDVETLQFPYADLFRDFSASLCRPNASLVTYGYGFGDDHINRVIRDMLTLPSTHLVILSFDDASGRIPRFCEATGRQSQISLLIGPHFGDIKQLVSHYLPKPAIDPISWRRTDLLKRREPEAPPNSEDQNTEDDQS